MCCRCNEFKRVQWIRHFLNKSNTNELESTKFKLANFGTEFSLSADEKNATNCVGRKCHQRIMRDLMDELSMLTKLYGNGDVTENINVIAERILVSCSQSMFCFVRLALDHHNEHDNHCNMFIFWGDE